MSRPKRQSVPRAPYAVQACGWCRHKRIRCTGERPICRTCELAGRGAECTWGPEPVKRPGNREYVRSLLHYTAHLEKQLELCRKQHGGFDNDHLSLRPNLPAEDEQSAFSDPEDNDDSMGTFRFEGVALNYYGETSVFRFAPQKVPCHLSRFPEIVQDSDQCYVLLVEGVDISNYNPNFNWSRYLPQEVHLERPEHDKLLDLLFKFFTSWCLRIVPALFLRDMWRALSAPASQPPPKTRHYSPMLHNALIALAAAFSDDPRIQDLKFRQYFAERAKSYIDSECREPDISVMNALSVLGSYHSSLGDQTLGYMYFGMSGRASQALGLSVDCSRSVKENLITADEMLDRNWAYWGIFTLDVCWSLYVGREFSIAAPPSRRSIPIPPVDSELDKMVWQNPPSGTPQPNHLSGTFSATCKLLEIGRRIKDVIHVLSSPATRQQVTSDVIFKIDVELNAWKDELSPEIDIKLSSQITAAPHRIMLQLAFWWLFINLHRPFYHRTRPLPGSQHEIDHVKICDKAARNIMELLAAWRSLYTLRYVPVTLIGIVFTAGTVFLLSALQTSVGTRTARSFSHSLAQADLCVEYLLESGKSFQCAKDIAEILRNLLHQELTARSMSRDKPIPSSSMYRESPCIPDSPTISPHSDHAPELVFDDHLPRSPFPTQPYCVWSSETAGDPDPALFETYSQAFWPCRSETQAEDFNDNSTHPTSDSASSSFQDTFDLKTVIGLSNSMYLEDTSRQPLTTFEGMGDGVPLTFTGDLDAFEFITAHYQMDLEMVN